MGTNYSISSTYDVFHTYKNEDQITYTTNDIGKAFMVSFFVGTTLITIPLSDLSGYVKLASNYSSLANIDYVSLCKSKENDYLDNSRFLDLLKIENLKKLDCMSIFHENWNGVGGRAFSSDSINHFRDIIENVCKQPNIAPTGRDSLLLQYELDDCSLLAFEVRDDRMEMVCVPKGDYSLAISQVFTNNFVQHINCQVAQFYGLKQD